MKTMTLTTRPPLWQSGFWQIRRLFGHPLSKQELNLFFERLATLLSTGTGVPEALRRAARFRLGVAGDL